jgi:hypothetical protein
VKNTGRPSKLKLRNFNTTTMHYTQEPMEFTREFISEKIENCERTISAYCLSSAEAMLEPGGETIGHIISKAKKELEYWKDFYSHFV